MEGPGDLTGFPAASTLEQMRRALRFIALLSWLPLALPASEAPAHVRGADELFWVPTLEQALQMSEATGRPLFLMGYSLVDEKSTYTKLGPEYCSSVF